MENNWLPMLKTLKNPIPITEGLDPLTMMVDDAIVAGWNNEGLPSDRMSTENATILTSAERWPLMIDPQLQVSAFRSFCFFCISENNIKAQLLSSISNKVYTEYLF